MSIIEATDVRLEYIAYLAGDIQEDLAYEEALFFYEW